MKKTYKELADWLGIKNGDIIKVQNNVYTYYEKLYGYPMLKDESIEQDDIHLFLLIDEEYEILPRKKGKLER